MSYTVEIDTAPAYELITSLYAYIYKTSWKNTDSLKQWSKTVQARLEPSFQQELEDERWEVLHRLSLLVHLCPGRRTPEEFIDWLSVLPTGEIYERLVPWVQKFDKDLGEVRDRAVYLLSKWNVQYFRHVPQANQTYLEQDAQQKRELAKRLLPHELIEQATNGLFLSANPKIQRVILIPQYHYAPYTIADFYHGLMTCKYSVDLPAAENAPSPALTRVLRALSDEKRVAMLKYLQARPRTFSELVRFTGLVKSNVYYHLMTLRIAGLVRAHYSGGERVEAYSLRAGEITRLLGDVAHYLTDATASPQPPVKENML